jgi:hypothetical protein
MMLTGAARTLEVLAIAGSLPYESWNRRLSGTRRFVGVTLHVIETLPGELAAATDHRRSPGPPPTKLS